MRSLDRDGFRSNDLDTLIRKMDVALCTLKLVPGIAIERTLDPLVVAWLAGITVFVAVTWFM